MYLQESRHSQMTQAAMIDAALTTYGGEFKLVKQHAPHSVYITCVAVFQRFSEHTIRTHD